MSGAGVDAEAWRRLVLSSMPAPAWLSEDGPERDVVLSSRVRIMRNLRGFRFPHAAPREELLEVERLLLDAFRAASSLEGAFKPVQDPSPAEREYLVCCRLASPDFAWTGTGRRVLLNPDRSVSVMVNEEDHLRLQAVSAGWSPRTAERVAAGTLEAVSERLEFAWARGLGFVAASPCNCGAGTRHSAMFHLIGLAQEGRLPRVLSALATRGLVVRGLFGEASRAVGAFVQVSVNARPLEEFFGAGSYLIEEERSARAKVGGPTLSGKLEDGLRYVRGSRGLSLVEALRVLAWVRWARPSGIGSREVDGWLTTMELRTTSDPARASRQRADFLRERLGL